MTLAIALILALSTPAHAADTLCGVTVGSPFASMTGELDGGIKTASCRLSSLVGTVVVNACRGKVLMIQWNRVYTEQGIEGTAVVDQAPDDMGTLVGGLVAAGWTQAGPWEDSEDESTSTWAREGEARRLQAQIRTDPIIDMFVLSLYTTVAEPCTEGL